MEEVRKTRDSKDSRDESDNWVCSGGYRHARSAAEGSERLVISMLICAGILEPPHGRVALVGNRENLALSGSNDPSFFGILTCCGSQTRAPGIGHQTIASAATLEGGWLRFGGGLTKGGRGGEGGVAAVPGWHTKKNGTENITIPLTDTYSVPLRVPAVVA